MSAKLALKTKLKEEDIQSYSRPLLKKIAEQTAIDWKDSINLSPNELTELGFLLNKKIGLRVKELLGKFPLTRNHAFHLPYILPLDPPFHTPYGFGFLLSRLRKHKLKDIRETLIKEYLTPTKEIELVQQFFKQGPDHFIIFDLPEYLNQGPVERIIKDKVVKILEGKEPEWQINLGR